MTGDILLNLDSEDEGEIFMGCAGGKDTQAVFHYEPRDTNPNMQYFKIEVKGLNGGHSGGEIHKGLGNANKILVRYLYLLKIKPILTFASSTAVTSATLSPAKRKRPSVCIRKKRKQPVFC